MNVPGSRVPQASCRVENFKAVEHRENPSELGFSFFHRGPGERENRKWGSPQVPRKEGREAFHQGRQRSGGGFEPYIGGGLIDDHSGEESVLARPNPPCRREYRRGANQEEQLASFDP